MERFLIASRRSPRGFDVLDANGTTVASVSFANWFAREATGNIGSSSLRLVREGFWGRRYRIDLDGVRAGSIAYGKWGRLSIELHDPNGHPFKLEFVLKGFRDHRHVLRLAKDLDLIEFRSRIDWKRFHMDQKVTIVGQGLAPEQLPLVVALGGFCARLMRDRHAAAH